MAIDYEAEYNNRARVPEHVEIFEQWHRDAEAYRKAAPGTALGLSYGPSPRQTIDLFPAANDDATTPLMMFVHGGWWRSLAPSEFSHLAGGPNAHGVTVAMAGYDLCPQVSIPTIIEQVRAACLFLWRRRRQRIMVCGHSAGGHLAACMVATDWKTLEPDAPADLVPAAYAISGVFDLAPLVNISMNTDLRLDEKTAHACSPLYWDVPRGRSLDAVVGALESSEFLRQSQIIAEAWRQGLAQTRYEAVAGTNHYTVIGALADPSSAMTERVVELSRKTCAMML
ncbi:MAG TPA: alpha/beta hydrolase [Pseudolabrys sp.]|nr:alpha/beta hydrolase [Pseudolabrys sp.]